jgi:hypothetical protein
MDLDSIWLLQNIQHKVNMCHCCEYVPVLPTAVRQFRDFPNGQMYLNAHDAGSLR